MYPQTTQAYVARTVTQNAEVFEKGHTGGKRTPLGCHADNPSISSVVKGVAVVSAPTSSTAEKDVGVDE